MRFGSEFPISELERRVRVVLFGHNRASLTVPQDDSEKGNKYGGQTHKAGGNLALGSNQHRAGDRHGPPGVRLLPQYLKASSVD